MNRLVTNWGALTEPIPRSPEPTPIEEQIRIEQEIAELREFKRANPAARDGRAAKDPGTCGQHGKRIERAVSA